jgi:WD repeat-containing protein 70
MDEDDQEEMRRLRRSRGYAEDRPLPHQTSSATFGQSLYSGFGLNPTPQPVPAEEASTSKQSDSEFKVPSAISVRDDDDDFGPALPPSFSRNHSDEGPISKKSPAALPVSVDTTAIDKYQIPISHQFTMQGHTKAVSSMALDKAGSRLITGGYDYMLRFWDFNGMDRRGRAFREVEADEGHQIVEVAYNPTNPHRILVVTASSRPLIYDRDGKRISEFARGDMYLRDMKNTAGHVCGSVGKEILLIY